MNSSKQRQFLQKRNRDTNHPQPSSPKWRRAILPGRWMRLGSEYSIMKIAKKFNIPEPITSQKKGVFL
jgi:hypothetical protein